MHYNTIMMALTMRSDEKAVISEAIRMAEACKAKLIAVHVNEHHAGEMSMMMDTVGPKVNEQDVRSRIKDYGYEQMADKIEVRILTDNHVAKAIARESSNVDLLILGHRKMNTFKAKFFDSIDEGIVNNVQCPILIISKN